MQTIYLFTNDLRLHDNAAYDAYVAAPTPKTAMILLDDSFDRDGTRSGRIFTKAAKELSKIVPDGIKMTKVSSPADLPRIFNDAHVIISFDVTPFAKKRLAEILKVASIVDVYDTKHLLPLIPSGHIRLNHGANPVAEINAVITEKPYKVYSAFYKAVIDRYINDEIIGIKQPTGHSRETTKIHATAIECVSQFSPREYVRLRKASVKSRQGSTNASWALARGIVSPREVYEIVRKKCRIRDGMRSKYIEQHKIAFVDFVRELLFRDFYSRSTWWWLKSYDHRLRNQSIKWKITKLRDLVSAISTAPPVIKTIYKSLVDTGNISNYGRMLFATWVYDVGADWHLGEALFRHYLIDYDFSSNHWNWAHHSVQGLNFQWPAKKYNVDNVTLDV